MVKKRTYYSIAKERYKRAVYIVGEGRYATVSTCNGSISVHLHKTQQESRKAIEFINNTGCGSCCTKNHRIIDLEHMIQIH